MPSNIEIKAMLADRAAAEATAIRLSNSVPKIIHQEDCFFACEGARLKLRVLSADRGELIRYERSNDREARRSQYSIARTSDPKVLLDILSETLGLTGVVRKKRTLYLIGQTRVHLDEVEGLGDFLELEVVLRAGQSEQEARSIAGALLAEFRIEQKHLTGEAYIDLLTRGPFSAAAIL
jgi:predicted adenylyl cyclase CyaB